jgi:hypothetical protein
MVIVIYRYLSIHSWRLFQVTMAALARVSNCCPDLAPCRHNRAADEGRTGAQSVFQTAISRPSLVAWAAFCDLDRRLRCYHTGMPDRQVTAVLGCCWRCGPLGGRNAARTQGALTASWAVGGRNMERHDVVE